MKRFCLYPFTRVHLSVNGNVFVCCSAWLNKPIGNFLKDDFQNIWNSEKAIAIRESIFDGSFRFCNKSVCPRIISGLVENEMVPDRLATVVEEERPNLDAGPEHLSLNYDYSCNLYCKSCRKQPRVMDLESADERIRFQDKLIHSDVFANARRLTITGAGEPFASRVFMDLLSKMDERLHPNTKITLRTNGNLLTPRNWERIRNAHYAIDAISISVDAASARTYRLLRRGGDFSKLLSNLEFLKELKKVKPLKLGLNFVVQKQNFKEMPKFVKLAKKFHCDEVAFTQLMDRRTYNTEELSALTIHKPKHPDFQKLKRIMKKPIFRDPIVSFNNLSNLLD